VAGLLILVEVVTRLELLGPHFPTVVETGQELVRQVQTSQFWNRVAQTLLGWAGGFTIAVVLAVPLGLLVAANRFSFRSSRLIIDFLRPIPPIAILPLAVLLVGTGTEMKIYLVAFSALWPILFQTMYGAQDVDPVARDSARAYGLGNWQQYRHVVLPSATPYIATGLRLAATIALVVTIATELIVGSVGLGYEINQVRYAANTPAMYALIFVAGVIGWLITLAFTALERRALFWHHSHRETNS
jgi:ABC-type nitrate/sulfonate/bicarbonate transport system permease component